MDFYAEKIPVFIVDDSSFYVKVLAAKLRQLKMLEVHEFSTGEEALGMLGIKPKIIITDYYLNSEKTEAINGLILVEKTRQEYPGLPAIILSGRADLTSSSKSRELSEMLELMPSKLKKSFEEGAFFYLMKNNSAPNEVYTIVDAMAKKNIL